MLKKETSTDVKRTDKEGNVEVKEKVTAFKGAKRLKRKLSRASKAASYCCEAAFTINVKDLPVIEVFK